MSLPDDMTGDDLVQFLSRRIIIELALAPDHGSPRGITAVSLENVVFNLDFLRNQRVLRINFENRVIF